MALSDAYVTAAEYRSRAGKIDAGSDEEIDDDLLAASRAIEHALGRFFNVDAANVARIYIPSHPTKLWINDLSAAPASIKIDEDNDGSFADETALASTDFEMRPLNATVEPEAWPYTHVVLTDWGTKSSWKNLRVEITGKWGWPAVPAAVKPAVIEAARLFRLETPRATERIGEMGMAETMSRAAHSVVEKFLAKYRVIHIA